MSEHQRRLLFLSFAVLTLALAGQFFLGDNSLFRITLNRDQAATNITISGRVFDRTCNFGFPATVIDTCAGTVTADANGYFSFQRPAKTTFCVRAQPLERDGYYGPTLNRTATSQSQMSYEWQYAGVNCKATPKLCNAFQNREDRTIDTGYDFSYQNITGTCNAPSQTPTPTSSATPRTTPIASDTINVLEYFLPSNPSQGLTGTHPLSYTVGNNTARMVKWADYTYETFVWDDTYIYLREDQSQPSQYGGPYTFSPGTWMKRYMRVGERISNTANKLSWVDSSCRAKSTLTFPFTNTLVARHPAYDLGGELGIKDVIVLKYDYGSDYEMFYYAKNLGLVKWELHGADHSTKLTSVFNQSGERIPPNAAISCVR